MLLGLYEGEVERFIFILFIFFNIIIIKLFEITMFIRLCYKGNLLGSVALVILEV